jgi:hypothetical protein
MKKKSWFAAVVCAATVAGVGANAALAGEVTGNGKGLWIAVTEEGDHILHGKSACAFSGREDLAGSPLRTQTPHAVWLGGNVIFNPPPGTPGTACNPTKSSGDPD